MKNIKIQFRLLRGAVLICILLVSNFLEAEKYKYCAGVACCGTGYGTANVQVKVTRGTDGGKENSRYSEIKVSVGYGGEFWGQPTGRDNYASFNATPDVGSVFMGWYKTTPYRPNSDRTPDYSVLTFDTDKKLAIRAQDEDHGTYYARFDTIAIDTLVGTNPIAIKRLPPGAVDGTPLVFKTNALNGYGSITYSISGETNGIFEVVGTPSISDGRISVFYRYTPNGNVHIINPPDHATLTITLSKGDWKTSASVGLYATVDLTPVFTLPASYNYNSDNDVQVGTTVGHSLVLADMNDVARKTDISTDKKDGSIWYAKLDNNTSNAFSMEGISSNIEDGYYQLTNNPVTNGIKVNFQSEKAGLYTADLWVKCVYYDAHGTPVSLEKKVSLQATPENQDDTKDIFGFNEYKFGTIYCGATTSKPIAANIPLSSLSWNKEEHTPFEVQYDASTHTLTISVTPTEVGEYAQMLDVEGSDASRKTYKGSLLVSASVTLAAPVVKAYAGFEQVSLVWKPIECAVGYIISRDENTVATLSASDLTPTESGDLIYVDAVENGTYTYTITSIASNTNYNATSSPASATVGVVRAEDVPYLGLWTGLYPQTYTDFPYKERTQIDISAAFAGGKALFKRLYVFGMTTNTGGAVRKVGGVEYPEVTKATTKNGSNAKTPCYIYEMSGDNYKWVKTINNMNTEAQLSDMNITADGGKYYFTGYCPYASCGYTSDKEGVIYVSGGNTTIDLYFDNCSLYARYKTVGGNQERPSNYNAEINTWDIITGVFGQIVPLYIHGSGGALVFESSSTKQGSEFKPSIHVRGSNAMEGTEGSYIKLSILGKEYYAGQYSSPLQIHSTGEDQRTILTIDDIWADGTRTNGIYRLSKKVNSAPSIDLGNGNTQLNINGGQLFLQNSTPASDQYVTVFAISCRAYTKKAGNFTAAMYGIGSDRGDGTINFNDGSIHCDSISDAAYKKYQSYYRDQTSMKCPKNTYINGGTYACNIYACEDVTSLGASPTNSHNHQLVSYKQTIKSIGDNDLADIDFPNDMSLKIQNEGENLPATLGEYYTTYLPKYGCNSLTANTDNQVILMLPYQYVGRNPFSDKTILPWVLCTPAIKADGKIGSNDVSLELGGDCDGVTRDTIKSDETHQTERVMWVSMNGDMESALADYKSPELDASISMREEDNSKQILNKASYEVQSSLYFMQPVVGDEWMLFVPPFDVSEVYVVETYPETKLLEKVNAGENIADVRKLQYQKAMDLLFYLCYGVMWNESIEDFDVFYNQWLRYEREKESFTTIDTIGMRKLEHFQGKNWNANYFLYQPDPAKEWGSQVVTDDEGTYTKINTDWVPAPIIKKTIGETERDIIMEQGSFYSMQFPYALGGTDGWNYWTGKYVIFKGYGPKTLYGYQDYDIYQSASLIYISLPHWHLQLLSLCAVMQRWQIWH